MLTNYFCKCDKCGATRKFANRPFEEILKVVRRDGWRMTKTGTGWRHYCAECVARFSLHGGAGGRTDKRNDGGAGDGKIYWWQKD